MRERPILFNGAMVRAILAGQKTQTRRACKPQPSPRATTKSPASGLPMSGWWEPGDSVVHCPFGNVGDRLWIRETWARHADYPGCNRAVYRADPGSEYDADRWRPSIHMPRWACRLVLEITAVRVERLQAISDADALAEGIEELNGRYTHNGGKYECRSPAGAFVQLWQSTGGDWDSNPWVWVIDFRVVTEGVSQHPPSVSLAGGCPPGHSRSSQRLPEQRDTTRSPASQSGQSAPHTDRPKAGAIA